MQNVVGIYITRRLLNARNMNEVIKPENVLLLIRIKQMLRFFESKENINKTEDGPYRGFGY